MTVGPGVAIPLREVTVRASRSSGPGGQHANVTASRIEAVFDVTRSHALNAEQQRTVISRLGPRVVAVAQDERSQLQNRVLALARLQARLRAALRTETRRIPTRPTLAARRRRLEAKRRASARKALREPPDPTQD